VGHPINEEAKSGTLITFEEDEQMEQAIVSGIAFNRDEAKISVTGRARQARHCLQHPGPGGRRQHRGGRDHPEHQQGRQDRLQLHRAPQRLRPAVDLLRAKVLPTLGTDTIEGDTKICKVSIVGIGMRSHVGVASKMFRVLSEEGINIQMISTSEIKTSVVIDEKYMELAVRALHKAFDLDQPAG
jgi:aspartate kinase